MNDEKVINTLSSRLAAALEELNYSERSFAQLIGLSSTAVNKAISKNKVSKGMVALALKHLPIREAWFLHGNGEMFTDDYRKTIGMVSEPEVQYKARTGVSLRFERFVREYATMHNIELQQVAEKMKTDYNILIKTINGHRDVDCELLEAAVMYLAADANDIVAGVVYVPKALRDCEKRISDLENLIEAQRETIEALKSHAATKAA
jgi:transcriptional regulator with XRE-family HTH domain